jgi:hypothetical protein
MKPNPSLAARAIATGKTRKLYLLGYVAGIIYSDGHEWLLTKGGHWSATWPKRKEEEPYPWPTREQALAVARAADSEKFPAFVRGFAYETNNPANAKGLREMSECKDTAREFVRPEMAARYN